MSAWNISATAIRNPIPPIVLFLVLIVAGLTAYFRLPINQLPNVEFPGFNVTVSQSGAAPAELESQVAQRLEGALSGVNGVKRIFTTLTPGQAQVYVELQIGTDVTQAIDDARDSLSRIRGELPADIDEPVITRDDAASDPIGYFSIDWPGKSPAELSWFIDNALSRDLLALKGVSEVERIGGADREVRVDLDPQRLLALGVTADDVSRQLRTSNVDLPAGRADVGGQSQSIRALASAGSVEQLAETQIILPDGRTVRLGDLGAVQDSASDLTSISRYNGTPTVSFLVQRAKTASDVHVFDAVDAELKEIEAANPGLSFRLIATPVEFIKGMHKSSIAALIEGALLAVLVVFVILRDWRATLIAAVAIPLATIPTFAAIEPLGFTLNMMTLIALSLVAGVLVDDAIVEIENIVRHMRMGKSAYQAALEAADEIGLAVVATSAAIIAVFLPVSFMTGVNGQFFKQFGITVAIAVFFSLVVARLITPMMAAYFLKNDHKEEKEGALTGWYREALSFSIRRPTITFFAGIGVFILSLVPVFTGMVPGTFLPRMDNGMLSMKVEFAPGTPLAQADRTLQMLASEIRKDQDIAGVFTSVNGASGAATAASINIQLVPREDRERAAHEIQDSLRPRMAAIPDVRTSFLQFNGPSRGQDIELDFVGDDPDQVKAAADALVQQMKGIEGLVDVKSSANLQRPEIHIMPRGDAAAAMGVSPAALATAVRIATNGDIDRNLAKFNMADRQVPIRVRLRDNARADLETIRALRVQTTSGSTVRLDSVADVEFRLGEATIERRDRQRKVTAMANVVDMEVGDALEKVLDLPAVKNPPPGVEILKSGNSEQMEELTRDFGAALFWGVLLIYVVLVLLLKDFFQPVTIMTALPLSVGGAFVGLLLANQPMSLFVFIGFVMLMGIVCKNSILLVDFAIEQMHKGVSRNQALLEAGMKRARPIIMTTIAMSAGMIPAAAGWGVDGALRQGMGVAVIGGLWMSTILSLVYVPAVFVLIDRLEKTVKPALARMTTRERSETGVQPAE